MSSPTGPGARGAAPLVLPLYTVTLFLSAFLLFAVQPLFTKLVLPRLGGSAAVWNTAAVFFQATLLAGYLYAHLSTRYLGPRLQVGLHAVVLALGCLALPIGVARGWSAPGEQSEIAWLIALLAVSIGLPFFAVSATAPLLQKWFAHTDHAAAGDPYFLYAGSNLGSLAALLSYPFLVEPALGLRAQGRAWTAGYALLAAAIAVCGAVLWRRHRSEDARGTPGAEPSLVARVTWLLRARWLALSVVPSALLLGCTLHIGTDIAAVPLLWVLPLALYLLTFVIVFARRTWIAPRWRLAGQLVCVAGVGALYANPLPNLLWLVPVHLGALFFTALVCHGELARLRPSARHLTEFYLWMSIGGVVGGILASIVAPLVFDGVLEYPLALCLGLCLRPRPAQRGWLATRLALPEAVRWSLDLVLPGALWLVLFLGGNAWRSAFGRGLGWLLERVPALELLPRLELEPLALGLVMAVVLAALATRPLRFALAFLAVLWFTVPDLLGPRKERLLRERSFFGVYSVLEAELPFGRFRVLLNGTTNHGAQNLDRPLGPTTYYSREGPVGQFFHVIKDTPAAQGRIGVIGLGVGTLACYAAPGQRMTYFEIDPLDEEIARDRRYFTFLAECGKNVDVVLGDGRLTLAKEPDGAFDALVVDAFSGDAIPAHLLTREALALYFQKLSPGGLLLLHVTNGYLDLLPVVGRLVAEAGLVARFSAGVQPMQTPFGLPSDWVVVARREPTLTRFAYVTPPWQVLEASPDTDLWTDDFTNVLQVLRLERYGLAPR